MRPIATVVTHSVVCLSLCLEPIEKPFGELIHISISRFCTAHTCDQHTERQTDKQTMLRATSVTICHTYVLRACDWFTNNLLPPDAMLARWLLSCVRLSVRLSVTRRYCTTTAKPRIIQKTSHDSSVTLVFWCRRSRQNSSSIIFNGAPDRGGVGYNRRFWPIYRYISETVRYKEIVTI